MMAQELDTEFSDAPTSEDEASFVPLEEIEHDPKQVEELVNTLRQVVQKAVRGNHQKPIESAAARLNELGLRAGEAFLDFSGFDEANKGYSPLMCACEENKPQIVKVLLEQGASVVYKGKNRSGISPVHIACSKGYEDILKLLLTHAAKQQTLRPSLNSTSAKENWTPLMYAVQSGHVNIVNLLLHDEQLQSVETGTVSLEACTKKKAHVMHLAAAARCQQLDCLEVLHSKQETRGLYLAQDKKGWNVLHYACAGGSAKVVQWLLKNVPELKAAEILNQMSENNYTPLLVACEYQKLEVVRYLLREDEGARDVGVRDLSVDASARAMEKDPKTNKVIGHKTGLHLAAIHDSPEIAQELIAKGCPLAAQDCRGDTALHIAHRKACLDVANILRRAPGGEQLAEIKNQQGKTPDQIQPEDVIPPEITRRGPQAVEAYRRALRKGKEKIPRCSLQILGEERVGKTSLLRSLTGKNFIEDLDPTHGIDNTLVDTLVNIRPISMAAWEEVKPQDQARKDGTLLGTGVIRELKKEGVLKEKELHEPKEISAEELLKRIEEAFADFEQPQKAPKPPPSQDVHPLHLLKAPRYHLQAIPVARPQPQLQPRLPPPELKPPILSSKREKEPKRDESHNPKARREKIPILPAQIPLHQNQPAVPTESRKEASRPPGTLVSRRLHQDIGRMIKNLTSPEEPTLHLNTYDFAGQKQYRPMHHCFITRRALYLVVFNLQHMVEYLSNKGAAKKNPLEEIRYWLNSIHAHIHIPTEEDETTKRVYLVGTHKAPKEGKQLEKCDLEKIHDELHAVFSEDDRTVGHLCYTGDDERIFVAIENSLDGKEEREASGIVALQRELKDTCGVLPFLKEQRPIIWLQFERGLLQRREEYRRRLTPPLITLEAVQEMGKDIEEPDHALHFFHDTGTIILLKELSSLFLSEDEKSELDSLVLLDPKWLIEVMKIVMELKMGDQKYRAKDIRDLKKGIGNASLLRKRWEGCYSESAGCSFRQLCLILQAHCLIYPLQPHSVAPPGQSKSEPVASATTEPPLSRSQSEVDVTQMKFLVPCMLPSKPIPDDPIQKVTFSFDFNGFLPAEIFHRLICLMIAGSAATRGRKIPPEFSATWCRIDNVMGRKWQLEMEPECHRLTVSVIPTQDEKLTRKPHSYISLFHHEFLQQICEKSDLQGLTYHGGPLIEKCVTPECPWNGVLTFVSHPEPEEPAYSLKVVCEKCNHEYDIDCLLKVIKPVEDKPQNTSEQQPQPCVHEPPKVAKEHAVPFNTVTCEDRLPSLSASAHFSTLALPPQLMTTPAVSTGEGFVQSTSTTVKATSSQPDATVSDLTTDIDTKEKWATTEPELPDLMNLVAAEIPSKWRLMGIQLYLTHSQLDGIAGDPLHCFSSVFDLWKRKETRLPLSWGTVLQALGAPSVGEQKLARKISRHLTGELN